MSSNRVRFDQVGYGEECFAMFNRSPVGEGGVPRGLNSLRDCGTLIGCLVPPGGGGHWGVGRSHGDLGLSGRVD
jgi:hypothetical protein